MLRGSSWAEAKGRVLGGDSLTELRSSLLALCADPIARVKGSDQRKYEALVQMASASDVVVLLGADGARWWYTAHVDGGKLSLSAADSSAGDLRDRQG